MKKVVKKMTCYCPSCHIELTCEDNSDPLPSVCPECGSDLYPEEVLFQQLISGSDEPALV